MLGAEQIFHHLSLDIDGQIISRVPPTQCCGEEPRLEFLVPDVKRPPPDS